MCRAIMTFWSDDFLTHLSAHVVNRLLRENRKSITKHFNGKITENVTLQILNLILAG